MAQSVDPVRSERRATFEGCSVEIVENVRGLCGLIERVVFTAPLTDGPNIGTVLNNPGLFRVGRRTGAPKL